MAYVHCPYCEEDIASEVSCHSDWDEPSFNMECPHCGKKLQIDVQVEEYSYEACKDDTEEELEDE